LIIGAQNLPRAARLTALTPQKADMPNTETSPLRPLTKTGIRDLRDGLARPDLWGRLGWLEVKRRYRRTVIGPFWSVVSLAIFVITIGTVGASLWNLDVVEYVPYLTAGMVVWLMISACVSEACTVFVTNANLYRNARFDFSLLIYALVWRNVIVLLHHLMVYSLIVVVLAPYLLSAATLLVIPGLLLILINGVWVTLLLGMLCLRFRDVQQLMGNVMQIAMLITPIFWPIEQLKGAVRLTFVHLNPLYHCIEVVRAPLLGKVPTFGNYLAVIAIALVGWVITHLLFTRFRKRISYWT
jgi:homopolymeric O-antigen transport system permease protein